MAKKESTTEKVMDPFTQTIYNYVSKHAEENELFRPRFENPEKNIEDCVKFIYGEVQTMGRPGYNDEEIFSLALHYYQEDEVKIGSSSISKVVSNHMIELTADEIAQAKVKAKQQLIDKEISAEKAVLKKEALKDFKVELTPDELKAAQDKAKEQAVQEAIKLQKDKLTKKQQKKKPEPANEEKPTEVQGSLF